MSESKGEGGSWLYGLILILAGGVVAINGILSLFGINWLTEIIAQIPGVGPDLAALLSSVLGYSYIALGIWGVIGGIGLIKDQEWGWGISLVVLSLVIVTFLPAVIAGFIAGAWSSIGLWIEFIVILVGAIGIVYLLMTKYKYA